MRFPFYLSYILHYLILRGHFEASFFSSFPYRSVDWLIYINCEIALSPHFKVSIRAQILEPITINVSVFISLKIVTLLNFKIKTGQKCFERQEMMNGNTPF